MVARQVILTFLFTFLMGMAIGVYVYFAGYAPAQRTVVERVDGLTESLVIVGEVYGGCERGRYCPSFQVADDGTYRYFYRPEGATDQVLQEGSIPGSLLRDLRRTITIAELQVASRPVEPTFCESFSDGIDVKYRISVDRTDYIIDSCGTDVNANSAMWQVLGKLWGYFETGG